MKPTISAVIPVYNGQKFIKEAIESIQNQTVNVDEIIIINDGSTDKSSAIVEQLKSDSLIPINMFYQSNGGVSTARNLGILKSSSDLIAFLDVDDLWHSTKIEEQLACYKDSKHYEEFSFCDFYFNEPKDDVRKFKISQQIQPLIKSDISRLSFQLAFIKENFVGTASTVMFNRELAQKIGGFNANLNHSEDFDFILRYSNHAEMKILNKSLVTKRTHDNNLSGNDVLHFWSHVFSLQQNITINSPYTRFNYPVDVIVLMKKSHDDYLIKYCNSLYEKIKHKSFHAFVTGLHQTQTNRGRLNLTLALLKKLLRWASFETIKR